MLLLMMMLMMLRRRKSDNLRQWLFMQWRPTMVRQRMRSREESVIRHWRQSLLIPGYYYIDHDGHWQWLSRAQMIFKSYTLQENCFPLQIDLPKVKVSKFSESSLSKTYFVWVFPQCLWLKLVVLLSSAISRSQLLIVNSDIFANFFTFS